MYSVFIVDDKKLIRESLLKTVAWENHGFQVVGTAGDGIKAEEDIRRLRPDVVITDIRMPGRDGLELASLIQEILPETRVIVITGFDRFEYAQKSLRVGAVDVILKPIRNQDIENALNIARRQLEQAEKNLVPDDGSVHGEEYGHLTRAALNYIEQNLGQDISLGALAEMYRVSPSHLSRIFKQDTGITFLRYLNKQRLKKALTLLDDPQYRISEIATACGFSSALLFSKNFKEFFGQTPRDYRRRDLQSKDKKTI